MPLSPPRRVLVLRFSSAGDIVLTSPVIEALKRAWPDTEIVYALKRQFAPLVAHDPHISHIVALEPKESVFHYAKRLRALACDATLDLHGKLRSQALALLVPTARYARTAKRSRWQSLCVRFCLTTYAPGTLVAERYHAAAEKLVGETLPQGGLRYVVGADEQAEADRLLEHAGIDLSRPILGMTPGANWETKRWPLERYAELAVRAHAHGYQIAITGNQAEHKLGSAIKERLPAAVNLAGTVSLAALGGFIHRCAAFVANDSGPMHIARALGVPTLAIFGSTDPGQFDFTGHAVLFAGVSCSPCHFYGRRKCPRRHFRCMLDLDIERAWEALTPLLQGGRRNVVSG